MNNIKIGVIIGISIIISSIILGAFFYQTQKPQNQIQVVGIASKQFSADMVKWLVTLEAEAGPNDLKSGYQSIKNQEDTLLTELNNRNINTESIVKKPVNVYKLYEYTGANGNERIFTGYKLEQSYYIISNNVEAIEDMAFNPAQLMDKNIIIPNSNIEYYYSQIDELKKDIISQAAVNANERALKMLEYTDVKLGKMSSINSGVFQITEPYSTRVSSGGIYETSTKEKQIKVTVHAVFELK